MYMSAAHYTLSVDELWHLAMGLKLTLAVKTGINIKIKTSNNNCGCFTILHFNKFD